jgi:ubiquinone/menaquinone biosynthesis C-methylase UbiE
MGDFKTSINRSASSYNSIAATYERLAVSPIFAPPARELVKALSLTPGDRVLDVGSGTGAAAFSALEAVGTQGLVVALDPSIEMLRVAKKKGLRRIVVGKVPGLPFATEEFDGVMASFVISHISDYKTALQDMVRVLRPGGRLGVSTWQTTQNEFKTLWQEIAGVFISRNQINELVQQTIPWEEWFTDAQNLERALRGAGLEEVKVRSYKYRVAMSMNDFLSIRDTTIEARFMREALDTEGWQKFKERVADEFHRRFSDPIEYVSQVYIAIGTKLKTLKENDAVKPC